MQSFKEYLTEATGKFAPWHERDPEKISLMIRTEMRLEKMLPSVLDHFGYRINKSGTVTFKSPESSKYKELKGIGPIETGENGFKFKYATATGKIQIVDNDITNLWGMPDKVSGTLELTGKRVQSLRYFTPEVTGTVYLNCTNLKSWDCKVAVGQSLCFVGVGDISFKDVGNHFTVEGAVHFGTSSFAALENKGLLGLLKIKDKSGKQVETFLLNRARASERLVKAIDILNEHSDILECQEALIEAGLKENARF